MFIYLEITYSIVSYCKGKSSSIERIFTFAFFLVLKIRVIYMESDPQQDIPHNKRTNNTQRADSIKKTQQVPPSTIGHNAKKPHTATQASSRFSFQQYATLNAPLFPASNTTPNMYINDIITYYYTLLNIHIH